MLESGIVVFMGLAVLYVRLGTKGRLVINSNPLVIDVIVFVGLNWMHWGTFAGGMVAATGALFASIFISITRRWHGYVVTGKYVRGWKDISDEL